MNRFINRLLWSAVTLLGTAALTFFLLNAVPGDVARVIAGSKASPEVIKEIRARYHLNDPWWTRLALYVSQLARGDLGHSYVTDQPVSEAILTHIPTTIALASIAGVMWMALARMLQYWLAYKLGWFPVATFRSFAHLLLPAASLAILFVGYYARLIHTNMVEVLDSPYIRAARAKGASEIRVLFKHALRNALIPVVTILGMDVAAMLGGVLFVENVFALPGIGTLALQSVFNLDPPMIMGTVLFSSVMVVGANWVVDLTYRWIDPRIKGGH
jgi:peptide/nickel transport system permease protein